MRRWSLGIAVAALGLLVMVASASGETVGARSVGLSWQTNGRVEQIVVSGTTAYMVGNFSSVRPTGDPAGTGQVARGYGAAVDLQTGALLAWNPAANKSIQTIAVSGETAYLGGLFTTLSGAAHEHLGAVDATSGAVLGSWTPQANGEVMSLAIGIGGLYLGGGFTSVDKAPSNYLAEVDLTGAALMPGFAGQTNAKVAAIALTADGTRLVIGGTDHRAGGR